MNFLTIILFLIFTWGLGFTVTSFLKRSENLLERVSMSIGMGLGVFVVLGVLLNLLRIPLEWWIFLILSLAFPAYWFFKVRKHKKLKQSKETGPSKFKLKISKSNLYIIIVLIIFAFSLYMYAGGAFKYPYLEDDDPWEHASSTKYVSLEKTVFQPDNFRFQYIDPYPPGYSILMGVLHQTNNSINWTLKFFNALIISLGIIFFYFFAKLFTRDAKKALFATFVLAAIPSFFTHFIWAHTLVVVLFFPAMYCLEMIKKDKRWMYPSMILIASILLTQPSQAFKLGVMIFIYWLVKLIYEKNINKEIILSAVGGVLISMLWWWDKFFSMLSSRLTQSSVDAVSPSFFNKLLLIFSPTGGTATRPYSFIDFFIAKPFGGINVQIGWGVVVTILLVLALIFLIMKFRHFFSKKHVWISITIVWFIFTFLGVNSMTFNLPIGLFAFRFWILMAIPVALLSSLGLWLLFNIFKKNSIAKIAILVIVVLGVFGTAGYQKFNHNTLPSWPPGVSWGSMEEVQGYLWLETLPENTKVFGFCSAMSSKHLLGFDKLDLPWEPAVTDLRENVLTKSNEDLHSFFIAQDYDYFVVDSMCVKRFGVNQTNLLLNQFASFDKFVVAHQTQGMFLFKIV